MRRCEDITAYLDGILGDERRLAFEEHLPECGDCARAVEAWRGIEASLGESFEEEARGLRPTHEEAARLVWRARGGRERRAPSRAVLAAAAVLAVIFGAAAGYLLAFRHDSAETSRRGDPAVAGFEEIPAGVTRFALGRDEVVLEPGARVSYRLSEELTEIELSRGKASFRVEPKAPRRPFQVAAGASRVLVVGTCFSVGRGIDEAVEVIVGRGAVEVATRDGSSMRVEAGGSLTVRGSRADARAASEADLRLLAAVFDDAYEAEGRDGAESPTGDRAESTTGDEEEAGLVLAEGREKGRGAERAAEIAAGEDRADGSREVGSLVPTEGIELWRAWILAGRMDEARDALRAHLNEHPSDPEAWSLLGDCERKRGSWMDSLAAYSRFAGLAPPDRANRARYKAAVILQDKLGDHRGAASALEDLLSIGGGVGLLEARARVRLASSYLALGRTGEARALLTRVATEHTGTEPAGRAQEMLSKMKGN